jgi:hypothetical protein
MNSTVQLYIDLLFRKYSKTQLTRQELADTLEISVSSLENLILKGGLPIRYKRIGISQKARYVFPIIEVANFLAFAEVA